MAIAPGFRQRWPLPYGSVAWSRRDPLGFLMEGFRRFGDVFRYQVGPFVYHLVSHPDHVEYVLQHNHRNYPRSWFYRRTKEVIGDGLVSSEGEPWRRQRRMVQPAFQHQRVAGLAAIMTDATSAMLERWRAFAESGRTFDVSAEMVRLTLAIVGRALLGVDLEGDADAIRAGVTVAMEHLDHRIGNIFSLPASVPTPRNLRFRRALRALDDLIFEIIDRRRREGRDTGDLISMLLATRDPETGDALTDRELRDQVITFIGAGHETTALALTWTLYLLARHPEAEARVRDELADVLGGRVPKTQDVPGLKFTRMAIQEALRLYPPVFALLRDTLRDDEIGGYRIPARSSIVLSPFVTHRHPAVWDEPERFDPDRFSPGRSQGRPRLAYFPFLGGPHRCIGEEFAMMEAQLIVAMVLQAYRLERATDGPVEPWAMLSLRPRDGLPVRVRRA
jgi:cytochrome P450